MTSTTLPEGKEFVAIGDAGIDFVYHAKPEQQNLIDALNAALCDPDPPLAPGGNGSLKLEQWRERVIAFGKEKGLIAKDAAAPDSVQKDALVQQVLGQLYHEPTVAAGCASANVIDTISRATVNGKPLVSTAFLTGIGDDDKGTMFLNSLAEGVVHHAPRKGYQKQIHIFQGTGDRILFGCVSTDNGADKSLTPALLDGQDSPIGSKTQMILLDGYMMLTGKYKAFADKIAEKVAAFPEGERPTIVISTASVGLAAQKEMQEALDAFSRIAPVIVAGNVEEVRSLLALDAQTNQLGVLRNAYERYCNNHQPPVTFLITNDKNPIHVVNSNGISAHAALPVSLETATLTPNHGYPIFPAPGEVISHVGAGDAVLAGFLLGTLEGLTPAQSIELGAVAAAYVIGVESARLPHDRVSFGATIAEGLPSCLKPESNDGRGVMHREIINSLTQRSCQTT